MRKLIWVVATMAVLWGGYWALAAWGTRAGVDHWVAVREAEGWNVAIAEQTGSGFPFAARQSLSGITMTQQQSQITIPEAVLTAPLTQPGNASLSLPPQDLRIDLPAETLTLALKGAVADMQVQPGLVLELREAALTLKPFTVSSSDGALARAKGARLIMAQSAEVSETYNIRLTVAELTPAAPLRQSLRLPADWPQAFDALNMQAIVAFDRPFDRTSKPGDRPQPRRIKLREASAIWGALNIAATADLTVDAQGLPTGEAQITLQDFEKTLDVAQSAGVLPPQFRQQASMLIGLVAQRGDSGDAITLPITFKDGQMRAGLVPLGAAPRIYLQ